ARRDGHPIPTEKDLQRVAQEFKLENSDFMIAALAQGHMVPRQIFDILNPAPTTPAVEKSERPRKEGTQKKPKDADKSADKKTTNDNRIGIGGLTPGMAIHMAKCCNPVPGEEIVGVITTGRGVTIHAKGCHNLDALGDQPDRFLDVGWTDANQAEHTYTARLRMTLYDRPGALSSVTTALFNTEANISSMNSEAHGGDLYAMTCSIEVRNKTHLEKVMAILHSLKAVHDVERLRA
ncbi:MAG: ACT domain-containing protein, partial [Alphaproteobacteria bacterium]